MSTFRWRRRVEKLLLGLILRLTGRSEEEPLFYQRTLSGLFREAMRRCLGLNWTGGTLFEIELPRWSMAIPPVKVPYEVVQASSSDLPLFRDILSSGKLDLYAQRLAQKGIWLYALVDGQIAYSTWLVFHDTYDPNLRIWINLLPDDALLLDSFTVPRFRGHGLHSAMNCRRLTLAKELGKRRVIGIVMDGNLDAIRVQQIGGARMVEHITTLIFRNHIHTWKRTLGHR